MNSKSLIHIILTKIFEKYEKDIQREKNKNYTLLNKTFSFDDIKSNKRIKCCEYEDNSNLSLNIDINIKPEHYKGKRKVLNKMKLKLLQFKKI